MIFEHSGPQQIRPGKSVTAACSRNFRKPLKWWISRAFFVMVGFWKRRNGRCSHPAAGLQNFFQACNKLNTNFQSTLDQSSIRFNPIDSDNNNTQVVACQKPIYCSVPILIKNFSWIQGFSRKFRCMEYLRIPNRFLGRRTHYVFSILAYIFYIEATC